MRVGESMRMDGQEGDSQVAKSRDREHEGRVRREGREGKDRACAAREEGAEERNNEGENALCPVRPEIFFDMPQ